MLLGNDKNTPRGAVAVTPDGTAVVIRNAGTNLESNENPNYAMAMDKDLKPKGGEIKENWKLDGQDPELKELKWPEKWHKSKYGTYEVHEGKLYLRPNEATRRTIGWKEGELFPFDEGVPDFKEWSWNKQNFEIKSPPKLTGDQAKDTPIIATELAKRGWEGCHYQYEVLDKFKTMKLSPHHFKELPDGTNIIQLAERTVHKKFRHTGPAAKQRS